MSTRRRLITRYGGFKARPLLILLFIASSAFGQELDPKFKPTIEPFFWLQTAFIRDETFGRHPTFQLKRTHFGFNGQAYDKVGYQLMLDGNVSAENVKVLQAWMEYNLNRLLNLRVGQFKYAFGIEAYPAVIKWKFIDPSFVTQGVVQELGRTSPGQASGQYRDIGAQIAGEISVGSATNMGYKLMLMNGNGILKADDNDWKDVVLHGFVRPTKGTEVGISLYAGSFYSTTDSVNLDESALGVDLAWSYTISGRELRLQGEYMTAEYQTDTTDVKPQGFYLYGTLFLVNGWEVGVRYDYFEPNRDSPVNLTRKRTTLSSAYHIYRDQKIIMNYEFRDDKVNKTRNVLTVLFQIAI